MHYATLLTVPGVPISKFLSLITTFFSQRNAAKSRLGAKDQPSTLLDDLEVNRDLQIRVWDKIRGFDDIFVGADRSGNDLTLDEIEALLVEPPKKKKDPPAPEEEGEDDEEPPVDKRKRRKPGPKPRATRRTKLVIEDDDDEEEEVQESGNWQPRIQVSEDYLWRLLCGHGKDKKRVPGFEWQLLLPIAQAREKGIVQGVLRQQTGQDKRSLPRRTDFLARKGYIEKKQVLAMKQKTSLLTHVMWLKGEDAISDRVYPPDLPARTLNRDLDPVPGHEYWTGEIVDLEVLARTILTVIRAWGVIRRPHLFAKLGVSNTRKRIKPVNRIVRMFNKLKCTKITKGVEMKNRKPLRRKDCIKYLGEPKEEEWAHFKKKPTSLGRKPSRAKSALAKRKKKAADEDSVLDEDDWGGDTSEDDDASEHLDEDEDADGDADADFEEYDENDKHAALPSWLTEDLIWNSIQAAVSAASEEGLSLKELSEQIEVISQDRLLKLFSPFNPNQTHTPYLLGARIICGPVYGSSDQHRFYTDEVFRELVDAGHATWDGVTAFLDPEPGAERSRGVSTRPSEVHQHDTTPYFEDPNANIDPALFQENAPIPEQLGTAAEVVARGEPAPVSQNTEEHLPVSEHIDEANSLVINTNDIMDKEFFDGSEAVTPSKRKQPEQDHIANSAEASAAVDAPPKRKRGRPPKKKPQPKPIEPEPELEAERNPEPEIAADETKGEVEQNEAVTEQTHTAENELEIVEKQAQNEEQHLETEVTALPGVAAEDVEVPAEAPSPSKPRKTREAFYTSYDQYRREEGIPGVYFDVPEFRRIKGLTKGRPRKQHLALFKSERLDELPWMHEEAPVPIARSKKIYHYTQRRLSEVSDREEEREQFQAHGDNDFVQRTPVPSPAAENDATDYMSAFRQIVRSHNADTDNWKPSPNRRLQFGELPTSPYPATEEAPRPSHERLPSISSMMNQTPDLSNAVNKIAPSPTQTYSSPYGERQSSENRASGAGVQPERRRSSLNPPPGSLLAAVTVRKIDNPIPNHRLTRSTLQSNPLWSPPNRSSEPNFIPGRSFLESLRPGALPRPAPSDTQSPPSGYLEMLAASPRTTLQSPYGLSDDVFQPGYQSIYAPSPPTGHALPETRPQVPPESQTHPYYQQHMAPHSWWDPQRRPPQYQSMLGTPASQQQKRASTMPPNIWENPYAMPNLLRRRSSILRHGEMQHPMVDLESARQSATEGNAETSPVNETAATSPNSDDRQALADDQLVAEIAAAAREAGDDHYLHQSGADHPQEQNMLGSFTVIPPKPVETQTEEDRQLERQIQAAAAIGFEHAAFQLNTAKDGVAGNLCLSSDKSWLEFYPASFVDELAQPTWRVKIASIIKPPVTSGAAQKRDKVRELAITVAETAPETPADTPSGTPEPSQPHREPRTIQATHRFRYLNTTVATENANSMRAKIVTAMTVLGLKGKGTLPTWGPSPSHASNLAKPFKCQQCGGNWKNMEGLKYHLTRAKVKCNPNYKEPTPPPKPPPPPPKPPRPPKPPSPPKPARATPKGTPKAKPVAAATAKAKEDARVEQGPPPKPANPAPLPGESASRRPKRASVVAAKALISAVAQAEIESDGSGDISPLLELGQNDRSLQQVNGASLSGKRRADSPDYVPPTKQKAQAPIGSHFGMNLAPVNTSVFKTGAVPRKDRSATQARKEIIMSLLEANNGVFPAGRSLFFAFVAAWFSKYQDAGLPDQKSVENALALLEDSGHVCKIVFSFMDKTGKQATRSFIVGRGVEMGDEKIMQCKVKMKAAYPEFYVPDGFAPPRTVMDMLEKREKEIEDTPAPFAVIEERENVEKRKRGRPRKHSIKPVEPPKHIELTPPVATLSDGDTSDSDSSSSGGEPEVEILSAPFYVPDTDDEPEFLPVVAPIRVKPKRIEPPPKPPKEYLRTDNWRKEQSERMRVHWAQRKEEKQRGTHVVRRKPVMVDYDLTDTDAETDDDDGTIPENRTRVEPKEKRVTFGSAGALNPMQSTSGAWIGSSAFIEGDGEWKAPKSAVKHKSLPYPVTYMQNPETTAWSYRPFGHGVKPINSRKAQRIGGKKYLKQLRTDFRPVVTSRRGARGPYRKRRRDEDSGGEGEAHDYDEGGETEWSPRKRARFQDPETEGAVDFKPMPLPSGYRTMSVMPHWSCNPGLESLVTARNIDPSLLGEEGARFLGVNTELSGEDYEESDDEEEAIPATEEIPVTTSEAASNERYVIQWAFPQILRGQNGVFRELREQEFDDTSYSLEGWFPSRKYILKNTLPRSLEKILETSKGKSKLPVSDEEYNEQGAKFVAEVDSVAEWEQGQGQDLLGLGSISPNCVFINHTTDFMETPAISNSTKVFWSDDNFFTLETLPYHLLSDDGVRSTSRSAEPSSKPRPKRDRRKKKDVMEVFDLLDPEYPEYETSDRPRKRNRDDSDFEEIEARISKKPKHYNTSRGRINQRLFKSRRMVALPGDITGLIMPQDDPNFVVEISHDHVGKNGRKRTDERKMTESLDDRIIVATVIIRTLCGGLDKNTDWVLLSSLFPQCTMNWLQRHWNSLADKHAKRIERITKDFQAAFIPAYRNGEVPALDYDHLLEYDWDFAIDWQMARTHGGSDCSNINLPATRQEFNELYTMVENKPPLISDIYFSVTPPVHKRMALAAAYNLTMPLSVPTPPIDDETLRVARSWTLANTVTPQDTYNADFAKHKLSILGTDAIRTAITQLLDSRVICAVNKGRMAPGRGYELTEYFLNSLKKHIHDTHFADAVAFKRRLDQKFLDGERVFVEYTASEGEVLAMTNLQANKRITISPVDPPCNKFGLTDGNYQTKQMDKTRLLFQMEIAPTPSYVYDHESPVLVRLNPYHNPPPRSSSSMTELNALPIWYDINAHVVPWIWRRLTQAVLVTVLQRPGCGVEEIVRGVRPGVEGWIVREWLGWGERVGAVVRVGRVEGENGGEEMGGWTVGEWWWVVGGSI
jgi:hypothetical protein